MLNLYRRHLHKCPHRTKGQSYTKCSCPIWCDGELNGKRYRKSLGTRDWGRAGRRAAKLEEPGARQPKSISEAIHAFHDSVQDHALATRTKYKRILRYLEDVNVSRGLRSVDEVGVEDIDAYRASRANISGVTWLKELEIVRQFFQFCTVRKWTEDNPAAGIEKPRNLKPNEIKPYTREEVIRILAACDAIGRTSYERLRARATILLLRYTALRIADVALLANDRVRDGEINVRTMKTGQCAVVARASRAPGRTGCSTSAAGQCRERVFFLEWQWSSGIHGARGRAHLIGRIHQIRSSGRARTPVPAHARDRVAREGLDL